MVKHYRQQNNTNVQITDISFLFQPAPLQRNNGHDTVLNHRRLDCFRSTVCWGAEVIWDAIALIMTSM